VACVQGVFEYLHAKGIKAPEPVGLQVMVHGVVPLGGLAAETLDSSHILKPELHTVSENWCFSRRLHPQSVCPLLQRLNVPVTS
jgi:hypothetical protein